MCAFSWHGVCGRTHPVRTATICWCNMKYLYWLLLSIWFCAPGGSSVWVPLSDHTQPSVGLNRASIKANEYSSGTKSLKKKTNSTLKSFFVVTTKRSTHYKWSLWEYNEKKCEWCILHFVFPLYCGDDENIKPFWDKHHSRIYSADRVSSRSYVPQLLCCTHFVVYVCSLCTVSARTAYNRNSSSMELGHPTRSEFGKHKTAFKP